MRIGDIDILWQLQCYLWLCTHLSHDAILTFTLSNFCQFYMANGVSVCCVQCMWVWLWLCDTQIHRVVCWECHVVYDFFSVFVVVVVCVLYFVVLSCRLALYIAYIFECVSMRFLCLVYFYFSFSFFLSLYFHEQTNECN